ncbi:MAG: hypothetical protein QM752_05560 [Gammaproteobacteria bacterium]
MRTGVIVLAVCLVLTACKPGTYYPFGRPKTNPSVATGNYGPEAKPIKPQRNMIVVPG